MKDEHPGLGVLGVEKKGGEEIVTSEVWVESCEDAHGRAASRAKKGGEKERRRWTNRLY